MIDIENEIFSMVVDSLRERYGEDIFITGEFVKSPSTFPCVTLIETDNQNYQKTISSGSNENHVQITYELNVYSNKKKGKKSECKEIISIVDEVLTSLGFDRTFLNPVPNEQDATIYRMLGRYRAIVSKNKTIYRR